METRQIVIRSAADAARHLRATARRTTEIQQRVEVRFDGWPSLHINVKGRRYHSSLTTPLMKAMLEYQVSLNRVYATSAYGASIRRLDDEDRAITELNFKISEGSSETEANLSAQLTNLADKLVDRLSPKQCVIVILSLALLAAGYFSFDKYLAYEESLQSTRAQAEVESHRYEVDMALIRENSELEEAYHEFGNAALSVIRSVPDATSVKIGSNKLNSQQIKAVNERSRVVSVSGRADGQYIVRALTDYADRWQITLIGEDGAQIRTDLFKSEKAATLLPYLQTSFVEQRSMFVPLSVRRKGDQIVSARIEAPDGLSRESAKTN
jgi:hypothetical protein